MSLENRPVDNGGLDSFRSLVEIDDLPYYSGTAHLGGDATLLFYAPETAAAQSVL